MIILFIIATIVSLLVGFYLGTKRKIMCCLNAIEKLKQELALQGKAWQTHCAAIRKHYQKVLTLRNGKCTCEQKVLYQNKYEFDPCDFKVKEKYHNVTIEVLECKKCGYTEISWFRQDDTEEVEVE